jgi:hypothetical protein
LPLVHRRHVSQGLSVRTRPRHLWLSTETSTQLMWHLPCVNSTPYVPCVSFQSFLL